MKDPLSRYHDSLLDFHFGILDDEQRSWLEAELIRDAELRARSDRLGQMLRPLDFVTTPPAPAHLVDKVLDAVQKQERDRGVARTPVPWWGRVGRLSAPIGSWRDMIAVAACLALLASVAVPSLSALRDQSHQTVCMSNLGTIFQGVRIYQASFAESLPFAGNVPGAAWLAAADDQPRASNSRHLYLVAKLSYGPKPAHFICPSKKGAVPMSEQDLAERDDFSSLRGISYDSLNLAAARPNLRPSRNVAYLGDANPLFVDGRFHRDVNPYTTNSPSHRGKGQAVLLLDGSVNKLTSPVFGNARDNLWLAGDIRDYTGIETPADDQDSFLVPGCPRDPDVRRQVDDSQSKIGVGRTD